MRLAIKLATGTALSLAMIAGNIAQAGSLATPAAARDQYTGHRGGGVSVGAVLLGAAVIGGIAAIASSNHDRDRYGDNSYNGGYDYGYVSEGAFGGQYGNGQNDYTYNQGGTQDAVAQCARAAENAAESRGGDARVTQIYRVDTQRGGARFSGGIALGDRYGNRYGYANARQQGRFTCTTRFGRVMELSLR